MTDMKIAIENAILMITNLASRDGTVGFDVDVSAHILRNVGGTRVSVYVHDKRNM
jgi:hypothetical protein